MPSGFDELSFRGLFCILFRVLGLWSLLFSLAFGSFVCFLIPVVGLHALLVWNSRLWAWLLSKVVINGIGLYFCGAFLSVRVIKSTLDRKTPTPDRIKWTASACRGRVTLYRGEPGAAMLPSSKKREPLCDMISFRIKLANFCS